MFSSSHFFNKSKWFLFCLILFSYGCLFFSAEEQRKYQERKTKITDEAISKSADLQQLNKVCLDVKLPDGFVFVSKGGIDDEKVSLSYHYDSDLPFDESRKTFESYFSEKGWVEEDLSHRYPKELNFTNKEYRIVISHQNKKVLSNYGIYCEKL